MKKSSSETKKIEKLQPKRIQTAEGKRRAMLRLVKGSKKKAA